MIRQIYTKQNLRSNIRDPCLLDISLRMLCNVFNEFKTSSNINTSICIYVATRRKRKGYCLECGTDFHFGHFRHLPMLLLLLLNVYKLV